MIIFGDGRFSTTSNGWIEDKSWTEQEFQDVLENLGKQGWVIIQTIPRKQARAPYAARDIYFRRELTPGAQ